MLSTTRVVIEHANSGIKRLRIIKDIIRIHDSVFRDTVLVVAYALHNFRTTGRAYYSCALTLINILSA